MKKLFIGISAALLLTLTVSTYAEVQNVKVGGELRMRAYSLVDWRSDPLTPSQKDSYGWLATRALVDIEADLTDNVSAVVELQGEGVWGTLVTDDVIDDSWEVEIKQAYVKMSELYYSPLTLKLGRQYLDFGTFLVTDAEKEFVYDAARVTLDFYPWIIDGVYAKLVETLDAKDDMDFYMANVRYEAEQFAIEGYALGINDCSDVGYKPIALGLVGSGSPMEGLDLHGEATYETGDWSDGNDLSAWSIEVGGSYVFEAAWEPAVSLRYIYASGDDNPNDSDMKSFQEFFEYDYYGYAFSPRRSNIQMINASLSVLPMENLTLIADYYYYLQAEKVVDIVGDAFQDNGGYLMATNGTSDKLGSEIDIIAEYDYSEDVSTQLYVAWFIPGDAYSSPADDTIVEIRGEILVSF